MTADKIARQVRFPRSLYARLKRRIVSTRRSANAEIVVAVEEHLDRLDEADEQDAADRAAAVEAR